MWVLQPKWLFFLDQFGRWLSLPACAVNFFALCSVTKTILFTAIAQSSQTLGNYPFFLRELPWCPDTSAVLPPCVDFCMCCFSLLCAGPVAALLLGCGLLIWVQLLKSRRMRRSFMGTVLAPKVGRWARGCMRVRMREHLCVSGACLHGCAAFLFVTSPTFSMTLLNPLPTGSEPVHVHTTHHTLHTVCRNCSFSCNVILV
jgi:hypothetical protein